MPPAEHRLQQFLPVHGAQIGHRVLEPVGQGPIPQGLAEEVAPEGEHRGERPPCRGPQDLVHESGAVPTPPGSGCRVPPTGPPPGAGGRCPAAFASTRPTTSPKRHMRLSARCAASLLASASRSTSVSSGSSSGSRAAARAAAAAPRAPKSPPPRPGALRDCRSRGMRPARTTEDLPDPEAPTTASRGRRATDSWRRLIYRSRPKKKARVFLPEVTQPPVGTDRGQCGPQLFLEISARAARPGWQPGGSPAPPGRPAVPAGLPRCLKTGSPGRLRPRGGAPESPETGALWPGGLRARSFSRNCQGAQAWGPTKTATARQEARTCFQGLGPGAARD